MQALKAIVRRLSPFVLLLTPAVMGCGTEYEEISRVPSPDARVDAVLVRTAGGGATVGYGYNIFIVPRGQSPGRGEERLVADHLKNLTLLWQGPRQLEIRYDEARIFRFSNFWHSKDIDDFNYVVELRLSPTGSSQLPRTR